MTALKLAYIEDEKAQGEYLLALIDRWAMEKGMDIVSLHFESAEEFLFKCEPEDGWEYPFDLIIIDIAIKAMNGLELAKRIRQNDKRVKLAFLTADREFAVEGYEVGAVRYLLKPVDENKLNSLLTEVYSDHAAGKEDNNSYIIIEHNGQKERINLSDILYVEAVGHYTHIHRSAEKLEIKASFGDICKNINEASSLEKTEDCFVKCHRSYLVNLRYVRKITREEVFLIGNCAVPVSRGAYKELNQAFLDMYR